jgi:hypothetical protein
MLYLRVEGRYVSSKKREKDDTPYHIRRLGRIRFDDSKVWQLLASILCSSFQDGASSKHNRRISLAKKNEMTDRRN